jgi:hypothetical protein
MLQNEQSKRQPRLASIGAVGIPRTDCSCSPRAGQGRVDDYLAVAAESQALNFAPGFGTVQPLEQLARSQLAFEAHHRVEFRDFTERILGTEAGVMPPGGEVRLHPSLAEGLHQLPVIPQVVLENDGESD